MTEESRTFAHSVLRNADNENEGVVLFCTVPNHMNWRSVKAAFVQANLGWVERIDLMPAGNYKKAYIYFEIGSWNMNDKREEYDHLKNGGALRVYYREGQYFNVKISNSRRVSWEEAVQRRAGVKVEIV